MGKSIAFRLESYDDYRNVAVLVVYSLLILVSPRLVLELGGIVLWLLLLIRWLTGECA